MGVILEDPTAELLQAGRTAMMSQTGSMYTPAEVVGTYAGLLSPTILTTNTQLAPYVQGVATQLDTGVPYSPPAPEVKTAGIPAAVAVPGLEAITSWLTGFISGAEIPAWLQAALTGAATGALAAGATNLLEGGTEQMAGTQTALGPVLSVPGPDIPLGGPGLKEPPAGAVVWQKVINVRGPDFATSYNLYRLTWNGKTIMASYSDKNGWHAWRPAKNAVIGKNMPSHRTMTRLVRFLKRQVKDASTILDIAAPRKLTKNATRPALAYKRKR